MALGLLLALAALSAAAARADAVEPDGSFVRLGGTDVFNASVTNLYVIVGGAAVNVPDDCVGLPPGCATPVVISNLDGYLPVPRDNTVIHDVNVGYYYRFAGGAPIFDSYCTAQGCNTATPVPNYSIAALDHMRAVPADGTFLGAGALVYRVVGGAPIRVSSCVPVGGCAGLVAFPADIVARLDHLRALPVNGHYIRVPTGTVYAFAGGAPLRITDCSVLGGCPGAVELPADAVTALDHIRAAPADGTVLRALPSGQRWLVRGGRRTLAGASAGEVSVNDASLASIPLSTQPPLITPTFKLSIAFAGRRVVFVLVVGVSRGARVTLICRRGCGRHPARAVTLVRSRQARKRGSLKISFPRRARVRLGARLEVRVTEPNRLGRYRTYRLTTLGGRPVKGQAGCIDAAKRIACPS